MSCLFLDGTRKSVVSKCLWFYSRCTAFNPQKALNSISWMPGVLESTVQHCIGINVSKKSHHSVLSLIPWIVISCPVNSIIWRGWMFRKFMRCRILEIDVEHTPFAWLNQHWFILVFEVQAHLALASPCDSSDRFKILIYEIGLLFQINWEPSNEVRGKNIDILTPVQQSYHNSCCVSENHSVQGGNLWVTGIIDCSVTKLGIFRLRLMMN